jgi:hypothetical protein
MVRNAGYSYMAIHEIQEVKIAREVVTEMGVI